jgi:ABC-type multidrug transport system ATPase subunit
MKISLDNISKQFGGFWALDRISLDIDPGQIIAVLGANGAGKTTLLCALAGIVAPSKGTVRYDGELFNRGRMDLRRRLMFLADQPMMFAKPSVLWHISMCVRLFNVQEPTDEKVVDILRHLDLLTLATTPVGRLSRGQIYKCALAALLVIDPELWVLDEPLASGMDPAGIAYLKLQARAAVGRGRTVIYTTQILDAAEKFSDRICVLDHGTIKLFGSVSQIKDSAQSATLEDVFLKLRDPEAGSADS